MKFTNYNFAPQIDKNLFKLGFKRPTDIQYRAIKPILQGEDVLAIAQTGTGKTVAFALPTVQLIKNKLDRNKQKRIRCVVMVPTHELAIQVNNVFMELSRGTSIKSLAIYGGTDQQSQIETLQAGVDIIVATPGRLFDLESQGHITLDKIEILVLDEADHMLELGFLEDMRHLFKKLPRHKQTLFFSATINEQVKDMAYGLVRKAVRIQISPKDPVARNIKHAVAFIEMDDKRFFLERIINENSDSKILVFVRTKVRAERVKKALERVNISSQTIHSDKNQTERSSVMKQFREGTNKILITTDVSARGIDIPNVEIVINYDLPEESENYVHRVGRTGRGTEKGTAISFCSTEEKATLQEIEGFLNSPIKVLDINKRDYEETIDLSESANHDWKSLIEEAEASKQNKRKKKSQPGKRKK